MPCAPASSAVRAARTTLGMPSSRVLRSVAILFRFTLSFVTRPPSPRLELLEIAQQLSRVQHLIAEMMVDERAHERLRLLLRDCARVVPALHVEERLAEQFYAVS